MFTEQVEAFIINKKMIAKGDRIVVGISGGPDSVCLLSVLQSLSARFDATLIAVHVHHGIRGASADEDVAFVKNLCRKMKISFRLYTYSVPRIAEEEKLSTEEAGRMARQKAFADCMEKEHCTKLALAHQMDDVAETMLFNLARGTGLAGLCSLRPVRGNVIRPLLCVTRREILQYLAEEGIAFRIDESNETDAYTRNKIRRHILPYLEEEVNTNTARHLAETADRVRDVLSFLENEVAKREPIYLEKCAGVPEKSAGVPEKSVGVSEKGYAALKKGAGILIRSSLFHNEEPAVISEMVRLAVRECRQGLRDISGEHIEAIVKLSARQVGKSVDLPGNLVAERVYEGVMLRVVSAPAPVAAATQGSSLTSDSAPAPVAAATQGSSLTSDSAPAPVAAATQGSSLTSDSAPAPGAAASAAFDTSAVSPDPSPLPIPVPGELTAYGWRLTAVRTRSAPSPIPEKPCTKWFDYDRIKNKLVFRTREKGDYLTVTKDGGRKSLSDWFIDQKVPRERRSEIPLIADGKEILWVLGMRSGESCRITAETKHIIRITIRRLLNE